MQVVQSIDSIVKFSTASLLFVVENSFLSAVFLISPVFLMASLRSFHAVSSLAGRRMSVAFRPTARQLPIAFRSASTHLPQRPSLGRYALVFGLGAGMGVGTCFAWGEYAPNLTSFAPGRFQPELDLEVFDRLLQLPPVRKVLHEIGSSSKLKPVFDNNELLFRPQTLLSRARKTPRSRTVLFRIEDTAIEPGKPNIVGFLAIVEPHPDPDMKELCTIFGQTAVERDHQGKLARPGMAFVLVECGAAISSMTYWGLVMGEGGRNSGESDNRVIEGINDGRTH